MANDIWDALNYISSLAGSAAAVIADPDQIVTDVQEEMLAPVSWVCPHGAANDHPANPVGPAQNWLATLVNSVSGQHVLAGSRHLRDLGRLGWVA